MSVLEISKWLPESKSVRAAKRTEYNSERVELPVAAEVMKRHPSQRQAPTLPLRPIEDESALAKVRQNMLLNVIMPDGAVGIHEQNVPPTKTPP